MDTLTTEDLAPLAEFACGAKQKYIATVWRNGDVIIAPREGNGIALAGYRYQGFRLHLAIGRLNDPKCEAEILAWCRNAMAGSGR